MSNAQRDGNFEPTLLGVSSADSLTPIAIEANASTKGLNVQIVGDDVGVGGGTQYTEADTDTTITGTAAMMEVAADTLQPIQGTVAAGLLVNLGTNNDVTVTGTVTANAGTNLNTSALATSANQLADGHAVTIDNISTNEVFVRGSQSAGSPVDGEVVTIQGIASGTVVPISGTVTADAGTNLNTSALLTTSAHDAAFGTAGSADAQVRTIQGVASMTPLLVDATGQGDVPVTLAGETVVLGAGTVAYGKLSANSGVDIGDVDITSVVSGSINGPSGTTGPTIDSVTQVAINLGAAANQVLVSSAASKQIWVYAVAYTLSVAGTVSFQDEDDTAITGIMDHAANSGLAMGPSGNFAMPLWKLATNKDLEVDVVTAAMDGWITYALVSV